jgi:pimeloyl-ACP methyl ester carboxylesterase
MGRPSFSPDPTNRRLVVRRSIMTRVEAGGVGLAVTDVGDGPPVIMIHGFPELQHSWRHQVPALVDAGYRVITYDQRGCGGSDVPLEVESYGLETLSHDVIAILDALEIDTATLVGHDWGSIVTYATALLHPSRVDQLVSLNVPYLGHCEAFPPIAFMRERLPERFGYVLTFQEEGRAEAGFSRDPEAWLQRFYRSGAAVFPFMTDADLQFYVDAFVGTGITGTVNWYRNIDANSSRFAEFKDAPLTQPTLLIASDGDPVLPLSLTEGMGRWVTDFHRVVIDDCGHWTQQERPEATNRALIDWLAR